MQGPAHTVTNTYEPDRHVLASKSNALLTGPVVSAYAYTVSRDEWDESRPTSAQRLPVRGLSAWGAIKINNIGQRTNVATTGSILQRDRHFVFWHFVFSLYSRLRTQEVLRMAAGWKTRRP